jgi:hypothetical protein
MREEGLTRLRRLPGAHRAAVGLGAVSLLFATGCGDGGASADNCVDSSVSPPAIVKCSDPRADTTNGLPDEAGGRGEGMFRPRGF